MLAQQLAFAPILLNTFINDTGNVIILMKCDGNAKSESSAKTPESTKTMNRNEQESSGEQRCQKGSSFSF